MSLLFLLLLDIGLCAYCKNSSLSFPAAQDGDSLIIVNEQKGKKQESSRLVSVRPDNVLQLVMFYS